MEFLSLFPSSDWLIFFLFAVGLILHLVFIKKTRLLVDVLALYLSFALVVVVPLFWPPARDWLSPRPLARAIAFALSSAILHLILRRSNLADFSARVKPTAFSTSLVYRIGSVGLFFSAILFFVPERIKNLLGPVSQAVFANWLALMIWFLLPLLFAFAYRFKTRRGWME